MNRHTYRAVEFSCAYGNDHALGLFVQIFSLTGKNPEEDGILLDWDAFMGFSVVYHELLPPEVSKIIQDNNKISKKAIIDILLALGMPKANVELVNKNLVHKPSR